MEYQFKPYQQVLIAVALSNKKDTFFWKCDLYSHKKNNLYICVGSISYKCIPYDGN